MKPLRRLILERLTTNVRLERLPIGAALGFRNQLDNLFDSLGSSKGLIMALRKLLKIYSFSLVLLLLLAPATCLHRPPNAVASVPPELKDLRSLEELKTLFNHDDGAPRLVLLLSPT